MERDLAMARRDCLLRRGHTWYWRKRTRAAFGPIFENDTRLCVSLGTTSLAEARRRATLLECVLMKLPPAPATSGQEPNPLALVRRARDLIVCREEARLAATPPDTPAPQVASQPVAVPEEIAADILALAFSVRSLMEDEEAALTSPAVGSPVPEPLASQLRAAWPAAAQLPVRPTALAASRVRALEYAGAAGLLRQALRTNDTTMASDLLRQLGGGPTGGDHHALAARAVLDGASQGLEIASRRALGAPLPESLAHSGGLPTAIVVARPPERQYAEAQSAAPLLSEAVQAAVEGRKGRGNAKTGRDIKLAGRLFIELVGDLRLNEITWHHAAAFRDAARHLPKLHGKGIYAGKSATDTIELADAIDVGNREVLAAAVGEARVEVALGKGPVERTSKKTINKHMSSLISALRPWCDTNRQDRQAKGWTPFKGEFFSKSETKADARVIRTALSDSEIATLFASPVFTGHSGDRLHAEPGPQVTRDARFWVPLVGLHQGARMDEILQLRPGDVEVVDGIPVFAFGRAPSIRVKTEFSRRRVPVHPLLLKLGILEHAKARRAQGAKHLFAGLEAGPDGNFSYTFTKWFTEYRRKINFYAPGRDFYALRHSVVTRLFNRRVNQTLISAIVGHAQQGVTAGVYLSGYRLDELAHAIGQLDFGVEGIISRARS